MMTLAEKLRASYVRRCHIIPMAREQSLADHLFRVKVITQELLEVTGRYNLNDNFCLNTLTMAEIHDLHEVKLGDVPTNGKTRIRAASRDAGASYDCFTIAAEQIDPLLFELRSCDEEHYNGLSHLYVKLADNLELMDHLGTMGMGPRAAEVWVSAMEAAFVVYDLLVIKANLNPDQEKSVLKILVDCCESAILRGWNVKMEKKQ